MSLESLARKDLAARLGFKGHWVTRTDSNAAGVTLHGFGRNGMRTAEFSVYFGTTELRALHPHQIIERIHQAIAPHDKRLMRERREKFPRFRPGRMKVRLWP
jgi:hypothetical protein